MKVRNVLAGLALGVIALSAASAQQADKQAPAQQAGKPAATKPDSGTKKVTGKKGAKHKRKMEAKKDSTTAKKG